MAGELLSLHAVMNSVSYLTGLGPPGRQPVPSTGSHCSISAHQREAQSLRIFQEGAGREGGALIAVVVVFVVVAAALPR